MWIAAAYAEPRFFRPTSALWARTLHPSQCPGPFLCSSGTGQHFLQEKQTLMSVTDPITMLPVLNKQSYADVWTPV